MGRKGLSFKIRKRIPTVQEKMSMITSRPVSHPLCAMQKIFQFNLKSYIPIFFIIKQENKRCSEDAWWGWQKKEN
jgi:hypothetical protein